VAGFPVVGNAPHAVHRGMQLSMLLVFACSGKGTGDLAHGDDSVTHPGADSQITGDDSDTAPPPKPDAVVLKKPPRNLLVI
jgi:hypothetical protein